MTKQLRIVLTSRNCTPSRDELSLMEREIGEKYFDDFPLEWGGWIVVDDAFKLSAQWLCPFEQLEALTYHIEHNELATHTIGVYLVDDEELEEALLV